MWSAGGGEEKAKLMFSMYDLDNTGNLTKNEFKTMLRSLRPLKSAVKCSFKINLFLNVSQSFLF